VLLVGVFGAGRVEVDPEQEADAVAADGQGLDGRVAAGVGGEGGELAGEQELALLTDVHECASQHLQLEHWPDQDDRQLQEPQ
jgi:hypothetical protein